MLCEVKMAEDKSDQNTWNEYSRLVLDKLETLTDLTNSLREDVHELKNREEKIDELKIWKDKMTDVVSADQLKEIIKEHKDLQEHKAKSTTIFAVIQFIIASALAYIYAKMK